MLKPVLMLPGDTGWWTYLKTNFDRWTEGGADQRAYTDGDRASGKMSIFWRIHNIQEIEQFWIYQYVSLSLSGKKKRSDWGDSHQVHDAEETELLLVNHWCPNVKLLSHIFSILVLFPLGSNTMDSKSRGWFSTSGDQSPNGLQIADK